MFFRKGSPAASISMAIAKQPAFLQIGVSGFDNERAPKIHARIEISDNEFADISHYALTAGGVQSLILQGNCYDREALITLDGTEERAI